MIIGVGYKARSGKDTIASYLVNNYGFVQESFAEPLKEKIGRDICGFSSKQLYGELKEVVDPRYNMTPRQMLQKIGTDAMRDVVHIDFWVIPMRRKLEEHIRNGRSVVVSDCRQLNEAQMIKNLGGMLWRVDREKADQISSPKHKSETELIEYTDWDYLIDNNGGIEQLYEGVETIMSMERK